MPRKLDPGLAQMYSNPRDLITSTMKSDPVRSAVRTSAFEGVPVSASGDMRGGTGRSNSDCCCAATVPGAAANAAAPAAALFRKFRRSTVKFFGLNITIHLCPAFTYNLYHTRETGRHWWGRGWGRGCTCGTLYFGAVDAPPTRGYVESSTPCGSGGSPVAEIAPAPMF